MATLLKQPVGIVAGDLPNIIILAAYLVVIWRLASTVTGHLGLLHGLKEVMVFSRHLGMDDVGST